MYGQRLRLPDENRRHPAWDPIVISNDAAPLGDELPHVFTSASFELPRIGKKGPLLPIEHSRPGRFAV